MRSLRRAALTLAATIAGPAMAVAVEPYVAPKGGSTR